MGQKKAHECSQRFSHDCAQPFGIDVRVAGGFCNILIARSARTSQRLARRSLSGRVAAVCRRMFAEIAGTRARWQSSLMHTFIALLLNGAPSLARKDERPSREVDPAPLGCSQTP